MLGFVFLIVLLAEESKEVEKKEHTKIQLAFALFIWLILMFVFWAIFHLKA